MKKTLLFIIFILLSTFLYAQQLPLLSKDGNNQEKSKKLTFEETTKNLEAYFSTKDINKKGSGYKPFKRWEYHWSHYLQADGTIAPAQHLWNAWEQKKVMEKNSKATSNWSDKGPFSISTVVGQGRINTVLVDPNNPNILYAGAPAGGLWKSTNTGTTWTPLTDDLPQIGVSGIAIDPNDSNIIYIATGDDDAGDSYSVGVLKSIDAGATWNETGDLGDISGTVRVGSSAPIAGEIIIDPTNSNKIWVATGGGLFVSENGGTSWENKINGDIKDLKLKPGDSNTIYAVTSNKVYVSTNGTPFIVVTNGLPLDTTLGALRVEVTPAAPNNVYILAVKPSSQDFAFDGIYFSNDSGGTFTKTAETSDIFGSSQAWFDLAFSVSNTDPNTMFVGVLDIWKSTDGGNDFTKINEWFQPSPTYTHADIHFMRYYDGVLYAGTDGGIYKSENDGGTFTDLTEDMSISQFYKVSVSKQTSDKMAGGLQDNGGFALSNNVWNPYHGGDGMDAASDPNDENTFYGFSQNGGSLSVTTDGGATSTFLTGPPTSGNWVTPLVINKSSEVYAGFNRLYQLVDNSWTKTSRILGSGNINEIEIDPSNNNNIFMSKNTTLYKSTDKGVNFTTISSSSTGITGARITSIEVHNSNSDIVWVTTSGQNFNSPSSGFTGGGVFKSINGGLTFTDISSGLPAISKFVVRHHPFTTNNSIYVGTALGVYHRNDDDDAWEVFSTNLPNVTVTDIEINPYDNTITAATYGRSIWQSPIPAITQPNNELDLIAIASPNNSVTCGNVAPKLKITNNGASTATSFTVNYNIDGGANQAFNWTGSITSNATAEIELATIENLSEGNHTLNAEIVQANDANLFNNNSSSSFSVNQTGDGQITYTFGDANPATNENNSTWTVSSDNLWEIGTPTTPQLNNVVTSGYVTNPTGNTPDGTTSLLTSPCYNLTSLQDPVLKFKMAFALEQDYDIVYVEYSTDQGATWDILGTASDPNWYNSNRTNASSGGVDCQNCPGSQWTGTDATLREYSYNLSAFNSESSIIFRFKFVADPNTNDEGVVVDDFTIDASAILSVNDFEEGEFLIYPNPSTAIFNIKRATTTGENMNVEVYDVTGKLIRSKSNIIDGDYELNMSNVSKGLYFLQVSIGNKRLVKKLIIN